MRLTWTNTVVTVSVLLYCSMHEVYEGINGRFMIELDEWDFMKRTCAIDPVTSLLTPGLKEKFLFVQ